MITNPTKLRIAQVSPLWESVPPLGYGGVELVVGLLTDGLVQRGHEVTLFASSDSQTQATLVGMAPEALRRTHRISDYPCYEMQMLGQILQRQDEFDIVHFHDRCVSFSFSQQMQIVSLHTLHYSLDEDFKPLYDQYTDLPFIHISQAQRQQMPSLPSTDVVYNGICLDDYPFRPHPDAQRYLAFVGRMSESKGALHAIHIAKMVGLPLKMAGKVDAENSKYFETVLQPQIDGEQIQYLGEVSHQQKVDLLGGAIATLFPITWNEPFGLVMIESMACGTPVLGMNCASVPEIIEHGKTGFICSTIDEFCGALVHLHQIQRRDCREHVREKFSAETMVSHYELIYYSLQQQQAVQPRSSSSSCSTFNQPLPIQFKFSSKYL